MTYSSVSAAKSFKVCFPITVPYISCHARLDDIDDDVPKLDMLFPEDDDSAGGLGVESGWTIEQCFPYNFKKA